MQPSKPTPAHVDRRRLLTAAGLLPLAGSFGVFARAATGQTSLWRWDHWRSGSVRTDDLPVGGLSGLAHDPTAQHWLALSDDRSTLGPARCHVLELPGLLQRQALRPRKLRTLILRDLQGRPFAPGRVDPEGLALRQYRKQSTLLWCSEGDVAGGIPPAVYEADMDGRALRQLTLPPGLRELARPGRGPINNRTLEGIAATPNGALAWVAMEGPLRQDQKPGQVSTQDAPRRITCLDLGSGQPLRQLAYKPDPLPAGACEPARLRINGIADILAPNEQHLWVLERAFTPLAGFRIRVHEMDVASGSDTLTLDSLAGSSWQPAHKRLLVDLGQLGLPMLDNIEGMALGPRLPDGRRLLVLVSDNNFSALQSTMWIALAAGMDG